MIDFFTRLQPFHQAVLSASFQFMSISSGVTTQSPITESSVAAAGQLTALYDRYRQYASLGFSQAFSRAYKEITWTDPTLKDRGVFRYLLANLLKCLQQVREHPPSSIGKYEFSHSSQLNLPGDYCSGEEVRYFLERHGFRLKGRDGKRGFYYEDPWKREIYVTNTDNDRGRASAIQVFFAFFRDRFSPELIIELRRQSLIS